MDHTEFYLQITPCLPFLFSSHRSTTRICRCGLLLPIEQRGLSVGLSVILVSPAKRLNLWRCHLGWGLGWAHGTMH